jgi:L-alanine-DL-glutamate epimerase-like enolase superfamily enzyme
MTGAGRHLELGVDVKQMPVHWHGHTRVPCAVSIRGPRRPELLATTAQRRNPRLRIKEIRELTVPLQGNISNAVVNFADHTVSLVAVITDVVRNGLPIAGLAFDSIGRFGQAGILHERIFPRLNSVGPDLLLNESGNGFACNKILKLAMKNEKPGGHGDRAAAIAAVELAFWDLNAKLNDEPAYITISRHFGMNPELRGVPVYAAGGYYYPQYGAHRLRDEFRKYQEMGFSAFKMKIGGASLHDDLARIEAALSVAGAGSRLAVDANGKFDLASALAYAEALRPYELRWFEEIGDPLDYVLNRRVAELYDAPIATGENLFSFQDVNNLLLFGGMRPSLDVFQMDPGLSYGLIEYDRMLALLEKHGISRKFAYPHGGHLINLHIVVGLELGGCEAYPGVFAPFGGYSPDCRLEDGCIFPGDAPGFGLEAKQELHTAISQILA